MPLKRLSQFTSKCYGWMSKVWYSNELTDSLLLCLFFGRLYRQVDGVTMGSPLGPTISNFCLAHLENELLSVSKFKPELYLRYVDDIFCVFRDHYTYEKFFQQLNELHSSLKFSFEIGPKILPFLDAKIELPLDIGRDFKSCVFRKTSHTGLMLNFSAMCPYRGKRKIKSSQRPSIIGRSEESHQVKAASKHPVTSKEHSLVYIGKLSHDTDEQAVRNQLVDCGITQVADVIKLNCRKSDEASFCVSLYGSEAENAVYSPDNWPAGIIVRPYSQRSSSRSRPNQKGRYKPRQWQHGHHHRQRSEDSIRKSSWKPRVTPSVWRDRDWSDHDSFPDYYRSDFTNEYDYRYNHSDEMCLYE